MPSKNSPGYKRPPSPYSYSQSPRTSTSKRAWRPLNGTGQPNVSNSFSESAREKWLRSLRQGTDTSTKRTPMKAVHGHNGNLNSSLASTSEYLRDQLGLPTSTPRSRRSSVGELPGKPQYKSQEDMYDEILALKKTSVMQKNDYDLLKAKTRRLEEENLRKEKYIEKLLDPNKNDESIRRLAEGKSGSSVIAGLKQRNLKLEKQLRDKEQELNLLKNDLKTTDFAEMKSAMEIYYQEVLRLRDAVSSHAYNSDMLNSSLMSERETVPTKIKALRKSVIQLTSDNNRLIEENQSLRRDLDRALDDGNETDEEEDSNIKYSAMNKVELVSTIKKLKQSEKERQKNQSRLAESEDKQERLRSLVDKLKDEKNELRSENKHLESENSQLQDALEKQYEKNQSLKQRLQAQDEDLKSASLKTRQKEDRQRKEIRSRRNSIEENRAASSIQRQWRQHREKNMEKDDDVVLLQSAFRAHASRQKRMNYQDSNEMDETYERDSYISDSERSDDDIIMLQSAMRGHSERKRKMQRSGRSTPRKSPQRSISNIQEDSDSDDDLVMMGSATSY